MRTITAIASLLIAVLLVSCGGSSTKTVNPKLKKGKYSYILTDSLNAPLVEGVMTVDAVTKTDIGGKNMYNVTGTYTITNITTDTSYTAFSTMRPGDYKGFYNDSLRTVNINTNPQIADANVFITSDVRTDGLSGWWNFSTFRGTQNQAGFFKASPMK